MDKVAGQEDAHIDPSLHKNLSEKLDVAYAYAKAINEKKQSYITNLDELETIYDSTASTGKSAES